MPKFERRHYEAIADVINDTLFHTSLEVTERFGVSALAEDLALMFRDDNPNFNREKFIDRCTKDVG